MKVSCVITTYNRPELVGDAIDSVLRQTRPADQIIVVDDNSSVSYEAVRRKYENRVEFVTTKAGHKGVSAARNTGADLASGEVIAFLDDDDIWLGTKLEQQLAELERRPGCIACSSGHLTSVSAQVRILDAEIVTQSMLLLRNVLGSPSKLMVRKTAFEAGIHFDESLNHAEDWDFYLRLCETSAICYVRQALVCYNTDHHVRLTNQFAVIDSESLQEKTRATRKNRGVIGNKYFGVRVASYYVTGIRARKNRLRWIRDAVREVGATAFAWYVFYKLRQRI